MRYKLTLRWLGTHYCGWQVQPNAPTICGAVQDAEQDTRDNDSYPAVFEEQGRPLHEVSPEKQLLKRGLKRKKE